jgi:hypothetical protein
MPRSAGITVSVFVAAMAAQGCSSSDPPEPKRYVEPSGGFSLVPPREWAAHKIAGLDFLVYLGPGEPPPALEFRRDLSVPDDTDVVAFLRYTSGQVYEASELLASSDFVTDSGLRGKRIVLENETRKEGAPATIRQIVYLFSNGGDTHAFWGSAPAEVGTKFDGVFDACAKSYRIERQ